MNFEKYSVELLSNDTYYEILDTLETVARNCYQSDKKNNIEEKEQFIQNLINIGHLSILEHKSLTFRVICDRSTANQIVRHRTGKYAQESQRYCNYTKDKFNGIPIMESLRGEYSDKELEFINTVSELYFDLIESGQPPEQARRMLPNQTKTSLIMTMDLRNLRHFLELRTDKSAQIEIRKVAELINKIIKENYPVFSI